MSLIKAKVAYTSLTTDQNSTLLTANTAAASSTLTVKNISGFAINQVLIVGTLGNQGAEIIKTHASTAPTGSTITLASSTVFPHSSSTSVSVIAYDQVEFSTATTVGGSKTVLTTVSIVADNESTNYDDTSGSTGYYFVRFKNSITSTYSSYSDAIPVGGYTLLSARSIIDSALGMINKSTSVTLSDDFAFQEIGNCQTEVLRDLKRWSFMQVFDYHMAQLTTGQWRVSLPTNIDDANTTKSIYNFRIGNGGNLQWVDKEKWNEIIQGISYTTLASSISVSDASITLTDSSNFNDTGTVNIGANSYSYTANDRTTNVLTIPASTTTNAAGADAFQGESTGTPSYWTTYGGSIYFFPVLGSTLNNRDAIIDYYSKQVAIVNDSDSIVIPDPTVVQYYLAWKFLLKQNNGEDTEGSMSKYDLYEKRKAKMIQKESINRTFTMRPQLNRFRMSSDDPKSQRLGNFL